MKVDLKKTLPSFAARAGRIDLVEVPPLRYLAADAAGAPEDAGFAAAVESLFPLAFSIKFASKIQRERDYVVPPLEALWWADDMDLFTSQRDKSRWKSTALLMLPEWIDDELLEAGRAKASKKLGADAVAQIRVDVLEEGTCVQTLHKGPFADEGPVIAAMHARLEEEGLALAGKHHEIYFSDPRRSAPEKLCTILRQPGRRA